MRICAWKDCNRPAGKGKYCPECAKIARAKFKEMIAAKADEKADRENGFAKLMDEAHAAGLAALSVCVPTPMVVQAHSNPLNDSSPVEKQWFVPAGPCGFAWVNVRPATSSFARWLVKTYGERGNGAFGVHKAYRGGLDIWVREGGQSIQLKEAYANAFAEVLSKAGIKAYSASRMD